MAASWAARLSFTSGTAAPARIQLSVSSVISPNPRPSRMTTPGTPASRTMRFEPNPMTVTGMCSGKPARK